MNVTECPNCGGRTKLQHRITTWNTEMRHVRTCSECPTEYEVSYADPIIENVTTYEE